MQLLKLFWHFFSSVHFFSSGLGLQTWRQICEKSLENYQYLSDVDSTLIPKTVWMKWQTEIESRQSHVSIS